MTLSWSKTESFRESKHLMKFWINSERCASWAAGTDRTLWLIWARVSQISSSNLRVMKASRLIWSSITVSGASRRIRIHLSGMMTKLAMNLTKSQLWQSCRLWNPSLKLVPCLRKYPTVLTSTKLSSWAQSETTKNQTLIPFQSLSEILKASFWLKTYLVLRKFEYSIIQLSCIPLFSNFYSTFFKQI